LASHRNENLVYQVLAKSWGCIKDNILVIFEELGEDTKDKMDLVTNPVNKYRLNQTVNSTVKSNKLSSQFFASLPDMLGIISDNVFLEYIHQYLDLSSLAMKPFLQWPYYIGRRKLA